jgi:hypothetical protein
MQYIINFTLLLGWISGIVLAHGFWSTLFAIFIPFWAWYLTTELLIGWAFIIFFL